MGVCDGVFFKCQSFICIFLNFDQNLLIKIEF